MVEEERVDVKEVVAAEGGERAAMDAEMDTNGKRRKDEEAEGVKDEAEVEAEAEAEVEVVGIRRRWSAFGANVTSFTFNMAEVELLADTQHVWYGWPLRMGDRERLFDQSQYEETAAEALDMLRLGIALPCNVVSCYAFNSSFSNTMITIRS